MPRYIVSSDSPIHAEEMGGGGETPEHPWVPGQRPTLPPGWERPEIPPIPPRDEWPPLPPGLGEGLGDRWTDRFPPSVGLPIPPTPEHPMVPLPDDPEIDPPGIWPPVRPEMPDLSGKTLALALVYVSRHVARWHWIVIDNEEAKEKFKSAVQKIKDKLPAGGVGGRPPGRPSPG